MIVPAGHRVAPPSPVSPLRAALLSARRNIESHRSANRRGALTASLTSPTAATSVTDVAPMSTPANSTPPPALTQQPPPSVAVSPPSEPPRPKREACSVAAPTKLTCDHGSAAGAATDAQTTPLSTHNITGVWHAKGALMQQGSCSVHTEEQRVVLLQLDDDDDVDVDLQCAANVVAGNRRWT